MMPRYRRKSPEVEARVWSPDDPRDAGELIGWVTANGGRAEIISGIGGQSVLGLGTTQGIRRVQPGDFVIRGAVGEWGTERADRFSTTYEPVGDLASPAPPSPVRYFVAMNGGLRYGVALTAPSGGVFTAPYRPLPLSALREASPLAGAFGAIDTLAPEGVVMWPVSEDIYRDWTSRDDDENDGEGLCDCLACQDDEDDGIPVETVRITGDVL